MSNSYINVTEEAGSNFFGKQQNTPIVMLNLLRFNKIADYSLSPLLAPTKEISGLDAYKLYMKNVHPLLSNIGGELLFSGKANQFLIGPIDEKWNAILLVKYQSVTDFMTFATDQSFLKIKGHRTAALTDSRLLPIAQGSLF